MPGGKKIERGAETSIFHRTNAGIRCYIWQWNKRNRGKLGKSQGVKFKCRSSKCTPWREVDVICGSVLMREKTIIYTVTCKLADAQNVYFIHY